MTIDWGFAARQGRDHLSVIIFFVCQSHVLPLWSALRANVSRGFSNEISGGTIFRATVWFSETFINLTELTDVEWVNMTEKSIVHFNREESVPNFKKTGGKVYFPVF